MCGSEHEDAGTVPTRPRIRACLFDMDGLLINSEDLITESINEILFEYGKPSLPWSIKAQLQGRTLAGSSKILMEWAQLPISEEEFQSKLKVLHLKYFPTCEPLPGVEKLLMDLSTADDIQLALATSSRTDRFVLKTTHLRELFSVFPEKHRVLGDDVRIAPGRHKPAPDIYLLALQCVNETVRQGGGALIKPEECLVLEDSVQGVEAGRAAGMQVVWVPHEGLLGELRARNDDVLRELITDAVHSDALGTARMLTTLETFPYDLYDIRVKCS